MASVINESENTNLYARLNDDRFLNLRKKVALFERKIKDEDLKKLFHNCFFNTIDTTSFFEEDGSVFILTGDIPAMWLRDSSAQVMQYLFFAKEDEEVRDYIKGVLKKQWQYIMIDPYANAFNRHANGNGHIYDLDKQSPWVWERKFELDSLCYPLFLACRYFETTNDVTCFDDAFFKAFDIICDVFKTEQTHAEESPYYHEIVDSDHKNWTGKGKKVKNNGMVWSGYRPSDDCNIHGYYIPGNMFIGDIEFSVTKDYTSLLSWFNRSGRNQAGNDWHGYNGKGAASGVWSDMNDVATARADYKTAYGKELSRAFALQQTPANFAQNSTQQTLMWQYSGTATATSSADKQKQEYTIQALQNVVPSATKMKVRVYVVSNYDYTIKGLAYTYGTTSSGCQAAYCKTVNVNQWVDLEFDLLYATQNQQIQIVFNMYNYFAVKDTANLTIYLTDMWFE